MGSIRPRILKVHQIGPGDFALGEVAVGSIRPRILKVWMWVSLIARHERCSGLDPTEDTESYHAVRGQDNGLLVGCSGLDPTEDTESPIREFRFREDLPVAVGSIRPRILKGLRIAVDSPANHALQWARSDRGY